MGEMQPTTLLSAGTLEGAGRSARVTTVLHGPGHPKPQRSPSGGQTTALCLAGGWKLNKIQGNLLVPIEQGRVHEGTGLQCILSRNLDVRGIEPRHNPQHREARPLLNPAAAVLEERGVPAKAIDDDAFQERAVRLRQAL